eukprot:TRINITY_DN1240_c0_g1_i2.p1 TRINITY_DN1240_c0_g1~~TRINITY_DN1240_c0_g1_i2.p1  ORF type:complete len:288 (-),score=47.26 TRINITY_DN1240_c0_g1_i2:103-966(-)
MCIRDSIYTDGYQIGGLQAIYSFGGELRPGPVHMGTNDTAGQQEITLAEDEFIVFIEGGFSGVMNYIRLTTSKGNALEVGTRSLIGTNFVLNVPPQHHVINFFGTTNGHLLSLGIESIPIAHYHTATTKKSTGVVSSRGSSHSNTRLFDDAEYLKGASHGKVSSVRLISDAFQIGGVGTTYLVDGAEVAGGEYVGSMSGHMRFTDLQLDEDEFLTQISGIYDNILHLLRFRTSKGRVLEGGNLTALGKEFTLDIPPNHHAIRIFGGINGHLHSIGCEAVPISQYRRA